MYRTISNCRICGNPELDSLLDLGMQALTGVFPRNQAEDVPAGPLELVKCRETEGRETCGLVQLKHSFQASSLYGANYGYRSGLNASMVRHLQAVVGMIKGKLPLQPGDLALDIGSNDSTLLQAMDQPGLRLVGMDPTGAKFKSYYPPHVQLIPDFFSSTRFNRECGGKKAKVVTSIAMFYDLEAPLDFMREVSEVLDPEGLWVFEQSYLPTMLEMNSYDTVCHEHLEYYGLRQIQFMAERAGLRILDVEQNDINGGSFCVVAAKSGSSHISNTARIRELLAQEVRSGLNGLDVYARFQERVLAQRQDLLTFFKGSAARGEKIFGYGASTKGNVLLQFCGLTPRELPFIVEVNEDKFGSFTPQTRIPIISESEGRKHKPDTFFVLPWHFREHIVQREQDFLKSGGKLVFPLPSLAVVADA